MRLDSGDWINMELLGNPLNWIIIMLVLLFLSYGAYVVTSNMGILTPKL